MKCKYCDEEDWNVSDGETFWHRECKEELKKIMEFHKILVKYYGEE